MSVSQLEIQNRESSVAEGDAATADVARQDIAFPDEWDRFVRTNSTAQPLFYRREWQNVYRAYGLRCEQPFVKRQGEIAGAMLLVEQKSPMTGHQWTSLPWFDQAGPLAVDRDAERELLNQASALLSKGRPVLQIRVGQQLDFSPHVRTDKVLMRLPLESDSETLWKRLNPKVRNQVRKSEKEGVSVRFGKDELLDEFFEIYSRNMRDLGSPSHSRKFFQAVLDAFRDESNIAVASAHGRAVGAGFTLDNGTCLEIPWASSVRDANKLCVNHGLYWQLLKRACERGFQWFHFGRSTVDSGTYHFKKQWGAEPQQLYWYFLSNDDRLAARAAQPPAHDGSRAVRVWKKLPLWVTRRVGPRLIAQIP